MASLQRFVPATCPMKFNKLNFVRHVAGTKYPPNWCCTSKKVSVYTRGHVAATYPWDMYPQHFHVCANVVILSLLHVPATRPCCMSPQCALHKFFVAATCRCSMSLQHDPSCLGTFRFQYEYEIEYEYDFLVLVCRLHIITSHTHPMSYPLHLEPT